VAIERGMPWGGWCPKGGWAEDLPDPPGLLTHYPLLTETPLPQTVQRTEWNVRDSDAALIITGNGGIAVSRGTGHARAWAREPGPPLLVIDATEPGAARRAALWVRVRQQRSGADMTLSIGGPRESEAPGIYARARLLLAALLDQL